MEKNCVLLSLIISVGYVLAGEGDCDSGECAVKDWTYKGEKQFACANTGWSGGKWCPTADGVDASGKYNGGGWKYCTCGAVAVTDDCDSGECTVKDWYYKGEKQFACANTGWSGGNWCPTGDGVDASGNYTGGWKRCTCGAQGTPTCESGDCPLKEWYYSGEKMFACSKPRGHMTDWLNGSYWCPTLHGVDAKLNWKRSSGWTKCKCGTPEPEMAGKSCDSGDCPVKEWFYKGKKQNACSNPNWDENGPWCPKEKGLDAKGEYISGGGHWKRCKCGAPAPEMAGKSCDSGDCPVKEWFYEGKKQNACSNPDWDKNGPWCPWTEKGLDAKGEYISGNSVRCKCGVPEPPVTKLPDGSECKYPPGHTMNIYRKADEACMGNTTVRGFTQAGKDLIVKTHNELRQKVASGKETNGNQPPAANMMKMKWNEELAMIAQRFVDQCIFGHDKNRRTCDREYVGQNAYKASGGKKTEEEVNAGVDDSIKAFYNEVKIPFNPSNVKPFTYQSGTGHYTQVVWADSSEVGCGLVHYKSSETWYSTIITCNYLPGGNWVGSKDGLYNPGPGCSACPKGTSCDSEFDALCS